MTQRILIDGTDLSWQAFADKMIALRHATEQHGLSGQVRPPRGCDREARRLIGHLDLADYVEVIGTTRTLVQPSRAATKHQQGVAAALLALIGWQLSGRRRPPANDPFRSIARR